LMTVSIRASGSGSPGTWYRISCTSLLNLTMCPGTTWRPQHSCCSHERPLSGLCSPTISPSCCCCSWFIRWQSTRWLTRSSERTASKRNNCKGEQPWHSGNRQQRWTYQNYNNNNIMIFWAVRWLLKK
jgi:hypothetical protein